MPRRNPVSPPELPRNAPVADVPHPVEIFFAPVGRNNLDLALFDDGDRRLRQWLHLAKPLRQSPRLDNCVTPLTHTDRMRMLRDFLEQPLRFQILDHSLPRIEAFQTRISACRRAHSPVVRHHVNLGQPMPPADFKVVRIVRRGNLHRACAEFAVHDRVRDDWDLSLHQRQQHLLPDETLISLVLRMHRHCRITQHRLRPRCGHDQKFLRADHGIADVPEVPLAFFVDRFQIAQRRLAARAPVDKVVPTINQPFFMQPHEHHAHGARILRRQCEFFSRPVAALPDLSHLLDDCPARFFLPFPHAPLELFAAQLAVIDPFRGELSHHHPLR